MKVSKIEWATCPDCKVVLNLYDAYPANILMNGDSSTYSYCQCISCDSKILVRCKVTVQFEAVKDE